MNGMQKMEKDPLISIIVPVYKTAIYLSTCIESILSQSYKNFELLLIDDGSPDESPAICDDYAQKDIRVNVIHKKNEGISSARNTGIDLAKGEYIAFIDSDDYVDENYLSDMVRVVIGTEQNTKQILVVSDYRPFTENGNEDRNYPQPFVADIVPGGTTVEQFRSLIFDFRLFPPYCKLYCKDIIEAKKLRFNIELKSAEDFDFNRRYIEWVDRICYIPSILYHYRVGYKSYVPSNHGVLGQSEIKSVHIMANGITSLAEKLGIYSELKNEICLWAAKKQYFNRLPMLFANSEEVGVFERYKLYKQLISDPVYYKSYKQGITFTEKSTTRIIGSKFDCFFTWWIFYKLIKIL